MNLIPLIGYSWADPHATNWHQQRAETEEARTRLWALVKYRENAGSAMKTAEFRVIIESMPDFCGGLIVRSPQVLHYSTGAWGESYFANPGDTEGIGLSFNWSALTQSPTRAIDLTAVTEQEFWTRSQIDEYGFKCIAWSVVIDCLSRNKRGFVGADQTGGAMTRLVETMQMMGQFTVPSQHVSWHGQIDDRTDSTSRWRPNCYGGLNQVSVAVDCPSQPEWYNANSGSQVHWLPVNIDVTGEREQEDDYCDCDDCMDEYDCGTQSNVPMYHVPEAIRSCYNERNYVRGVPRKFWRNG